MRLFIRYRTMRFILSVTLAGLLFGACKKDNDPIFYGYEAYPLEEGTYVIYDVVDIFHDVLLSPAHDTAKYQIKEIIGETEVDGEGEEYQKLYRYYRLTSSDVWTIKDVWTVKRTPRTLETLEENKRRISLAFSISYDQVWDYNALNEDEELTARYDEIYESMVVNGQSFDSTLIVDIEDVTTFIDYRRQYDVYAVGVGRIMRVKKDLEILNSDTSNIQKGTELFYTVSSFGVE